MYKINFVCPVCKGTTIEQISIGSFAHTFNEIEEDGYIDSITLKEYNIEAVERYQCNNCGLILTLYNSEKLFSWLKENNMLEETKEV